MSCIQAKEISNNNTEAIEITEKSNFTQLNYEINNNDKNTIELNNRYTYKSGENNISINKSITIKGNNNVIDFNKEGAFVISNDNVSLVFKNVKFKNYKNIINTNNSYNLNVTLLNCKLVTDEINNTIVLDEFDLTKRSECGPIPSNIKKLAKKIVGKSTGMKAVEKLARWVKNKVAHETAGGFYQTPSVTLKRKLGNCCCHSELFLQMCVAVGLNKQFKLSFVHVGNMGRGYRHYFTLIDNFCVDTDCHVADPMYYGAGVTRWGVYEITEYPYLPHY